MVNRSGVNRSGMSCLRTRGKGAAAFPSRSVLASGAPGAPWSARRQRTAGTQVNGTEGPRPIDPDLPRAVNPWEVLPAPPAPRGKPFGPWQGLWLVILFMLVQVGAATALALFR